MWMVRDVDLNYWVENFLSWSLTVRETSLRRKGKMVGTIEEERGLG